MASDIHQVTVLLLGDRGTGKTSLAKTLTEGVFPSVDVLAAMEDRCHQHRSVKQTSVTVGDSVYIIQMIDPDNDNVVTENLPRVDVYHLCFDINSPQSFNNISQRWLSHIPANSKVILIGLKSDLAYDKSTRHQLQSQGLQAVTQETGSSLAQKIKASQYIEVSALKYLGIEQLKDQTVFDFINQNSKQHCSRKNRCTVM